MIFEKTMIYTHMFFLYPIFCLFQDGYKYKVSQDSGVLPEWAPANVHSEDASGPKCPKGSKYLFGTYTGPKVMIWKLLKGSCIYYTVTWSLWVWLLRTFL